ncbi:MAG: spore coat protein [Clostridia bacterium]|nr:spore coat protein [Clostridia bacterium]
MDMNNTCTKLSDKDMMTDMLTAEKFLCSAYNTYATEAGTPEVHQAMMSLLNDTHAMQTEVWTEMNSRGWYPTEKAEDQKLQQEKTKYNTFCAACQV